MSRVKEPNYFAEEVRLENFCDTFRSKAERLDPVLQGFLAGPMTDWCSAGPVARWPDYVKLFSPADRETAIGEASVCYLWSRTAAPNIIAAVAPDARCVIVLRNPIERAFSQYTHALRFSERFFTNEHLDAAIHSNSTQFSELFPFLEFGLYGQQLERLFERVPRSNVSIHMYEDFCQDPMDVARRIFEFLSVDPGFVPDFGQRHMVSRVPRSHGLRRVLKRLGVWQAGSCLLSAGLREAVRDRVFRPRRSLAMQAGDRARLAEYYRGDVGKLSALLGRDLRGWLD